MTDPKIIDWRARALAAEKRRAELAAYVPRLERAGESLSARLERALDELEESVERERELHKVIEAWQKDGALKRVIARAEAEALDRTLGVLERHVYTHSAQIEVEEMRDEARRQAEESKT